MADPFDNAPFDIEPVIVTLADGMAAYFEKNGVNTSVVLGWKERTKQTNQGPGGANRVTIAPSDDQGNGGTLRPPQGPGPRIVTDGPGGPRVATVRSLRNWDQNVVISIWADGQTPHNERETIIAVIRLLEWTVRAINSCGISGALEWGTTQWTMDPKELTRGRELRLTLTVKQPLLDLPAFYVTPGFTLTADPPRDPED